ncbi:MAG: hypothetical protein KDC48_22925, partial [Planctomycetes bacterium]|nr:hypothetical protein [Planctomycetota bacterium]
LLLAALWLAIALPLAAQDFRWDIPAHGAEVYRRDELRFEVTPPASKFRPEVAVLDGGNPTPHQWRYLATGKNDIPAGCENELFDDSQWLIGPAGFGSDAGNNPRHRSPWRTDVLNLRSKVDLGKKQPKALRFLIDHDDGVRVWLNGAMIVADDGFGMGRSYIVTGPALDAWHRGDNVLAVRCTNTGGPGYLDLQVEVYPNLPRELRRAEDLAQALREEREATNRIRRDLFADFRPAPVVLQGELDASGKYVPWAPADLRELAWWAASDLRCGAFGGAVSLDAQRIYQLG